MEQEKHIFKIIEGVILTNAEGDDLMFWITHWMNTFIASKFIKKCQQLELNIDTLKADGDDLTTTAKIEENDIMIRTCADMGWVDDERHNDAKELLIEAWIEFHNYTRKDGMPERIGILYHNKGENIYTIDNKLIKLQAWEPTIIQIIQEHEDIHGMNKNDLIEMWEEWTEASFNNEA